MKYVVSTALIATLFFSGCGNEEHSNEVNATYSPIITLSALNYIKEANLSMISSNAEYIGLLGQYKFNKIQNFYTMKSEGGLYTDNSGLEFTKATPRCDSNHTSKMQINVLMPHLSAPDKNSSQFVYINANIFTSLLSIRSKDALAEKYPASYLMNSDFNYDALRATYTTYSSDIGAIGGKAARSDRLYEFCAAAEELIFDEKIIKDYPVRVTSLYQIKEANVSMSGIKGVYSENGKYTFEDVKSAEAISVVGGTYITDENNESDYNLTLASTCPDINITEMEFMLSAPKVDENQTPYMFITPFTTLLAQGAKAKDLNDTYPIAYNSEENFNFDTAYKRRTFVDTNESNFTKELCDAMKAIQK